MKQFKCLENDRHYVSKACIERIGSATHMADLIRPKDRKGYLNNRKNPNQSPNKKCKD